ncbi:septum formation initiator family protein [Gudongella sp. DL1XJH-153]|uniref:septum formation initiator family protein n=1 Tax=Gudongella sp. DL1XJH-153 TaxID=3409804 RepID=UPI003BB58E96
MMAAKVLYDQYPEYIGEKEQKRVRTTIRKKSYSLNRRMYISLAIILLSTSLFILQGYAKITSMRLEITSLENEATELEKLKQDLAGTLEGLKNTTLISEQAKNSLGMIYPEEGQIEYITVNDSISNDSYQVTLQDKVRNVIGIFASLY